MNGFRFTEYIAASPAQVFGVVSDPTRAPAFIEGITHSTKLTDGPIGVGTAFQETRVVNGKTATADLHVTAYDPDAHVAISSAAEGITVTYRYRLAPEGDGTSLEWTCELEATGLRRMMLPMVAAIMKKEDGDHLRLLKTHLETTPTSEEHP